MTHHPRFQIVTNDPEWCYREHHGAALVAWMLCAAYWWLSRRARCPFVVVLQRLNQHQIYPIHPWWRVRHDAPERCYHTDTSRRPDREPASNSDDGARRACAGHHVRGAGTTAAQRELTWLVVAP